MALTKALYLCTGKQSFEEVSLQELNQLVQQYPYFAVGHLLLAAKSQKEIASANVALSTVQKTALYSTNPYWIQYQITNAHADASSVSGITSEPIVPASFTQRPFVHPLAVSEANDIGQLTSVENIVPTAPQFIPDTTSPISSNTSIQWDPYVDVPGVVSFGNNEQQNASDVASPFSEQITPVGKVETNRDVPANNGSIEIPSLEQVRRMLHGESDATSEVVQPIVNDALQLTPVTSPDFPTTATFYETSKPKPIINNSNLDDVVIGGNNTIGISAPRVTHLPSENTPHSTVVESTKPPQIVEPIQQNAVTISEAAITINEQSIEQKQQQNLSTVLKNQLASFTKPVDENAKLEYENEQNERLYTIDYFESQGIKIDLTQQPQDKLTTQLRRFTDWLKQMKKVDPNPHDLGTDPELESAIADIAQTSISAREIVTETMADIFVKQGKVDKAIQLYIKLSFLDPDKSAYFADKIQQLKGI